MHFRFVAGSSKMSGILRCLGSGVERGPVDGVGLGVSACSLGMATDAGWALDDGAFGD